METVKCAYCEERCESAGLTAAGEVLCLSCKKLSDKGFLKAEIAHTRKKDRIRDEYEDDVKKLSKFIFFELDPDMEYKDITKGTGKKDSCRYMFQLGIFFTLAFLVDYGEYQAVRNLWKMTGKREKMMEEMEKENVPEGLEKFDLEIDREKLKNFDGNMATVEGLLRMFTEVCFNGDWNAHLKWAQEKDRKEDVELIQQIIKEKGLS